MKNEEVTVSYKDDEETSGKLTIVKLLTGVFDNFSATSGGGMVLFCIFTFGFPL